MDSYLGRTSRYLRNSLGLTQRDMASQLGISVVHYCNIENGKAHPSPELLGQYRDIWDVDLYVLGWSLYGDVSRLPTALQNAATAISRSWKKELRQKLKKDRQAAD